MIVRGSQKPPAIHFDKTMVWVRSNPVEINEPGEGGMPGFKGWEYEEQKYTYPEYLALREKQHNEKVLELEVALAELAGEVSNG